VNERISSVMNQSPNTPGTMPVRSVGVLGLGYVGLPLAAAFCKVIPTVGFDNNPQRIKELQTGLDKNDDVTQEDLSNSHLQLTANPKMLEECDFLIVAVPTPVDDAKRPDLTALIGASRLIAQVLKDKHDQIGKSDSANQSGTPIVVYESTVYPGCIEEVCVPVLEKESGLVAGRDFTVGYSPERINPGDQEHTLDAIVKVVSAQDPDTLEVVAQMYGLLTHAGVYKAPNIRTAEAAKVIENIQRDLNIALMNELSIVFHRLDLDTQEVLKAARTKWNFLPFSPGLVGGECIPVDPYYLTTKAEAVGYQPEVILAGRKINDGMGRYVAQETVRCLTQAGKSANGATVLILGVAFKENVRDTRNSGVINMARELENEGCTVFVDDPVVGASTIEGLGFRSAEHSFAGHSRYDAVVLAVSHEVFLENDIGSYVRLLKDDKGQGVLIDVKGVLPKPGKENSDVLYWSL
jgi:UDP-N-acetyl-D-galactosamine dehydrogenase